MKRFACGLAVLAGLIFAVIPAAHAAVTITFYSHKFRLFHGFATEYPHGFVVLSGTTSAGQPVKESLGFSATTIYAMALLMPIDGGLDDPYPDDYVAQAVPHFSFPLTDAQYSAVMATAEAWRTARQPSYDFYKRNCVTFVRDIAVAAGLSVSYSDKFIHAPKEFLDDVAVRNRAFLAQFGNKLMESQPAQAVATMAEPAASPAP